jgi:hypothetical protein
MIRALSLAALLAFSQAALGAPQWVEVEGSPWQGKVATLYGSIRIPSISGTRGGTEYYYLPSDRWDEFQGIFAQAGDRLVGELKFAGSANAAGSSLWFPHNKVVVPIGRFDVVAPETGFFFPGLWMELSLQPGNWDEDSYVGESQAGGAVWIDNAQHLRLVPVPEPASALLLLLGPAWWWCKHVTVRRANRS